MTIFDETQLITAYCWDIKTGIFTHAIEQRVERGFGLPGGMTEEPPIIESGKIAIRDVSTHQWRYEDDDRGRVFYFKYDGSPYVTYHLNEEIDPHDFTKIEPPTLKKGELVRFNDEFQSWTIGLDWYEKPVWNALKEKSIFVGDFFVPNQYLTNIEPLEVNDKATLSSDGQWVLKVTVYHKETHHEKQIDDVALITDDYTQQKPLTQWDKWIDEQWKTDEQSRYIDEYERVDATREIIYQQMIDPLEGEAARKARQGKMEEAQVLWVRIDEIEAKIKIDNPFPQPPK